MQTMRKLTLALLLVLIPAAAHAPPFYWPGALSGGPSHGGPGPTTLTYLFGQDSGWTTSGSIGAIGSNVQWPGVPIAVCNGTWTLDADASSGQTALDSYTCVAGTAASIAFSGGPSFSTGAITQATFIGSATVPPACTGTFGAGSWCVVVATVKSSSASSGTLNLTDTNSNSYSSPSLSWTQSGTSVTTISSCSTLNGATLSNINVIAVSCTGGSAGVTFHTASNAIVLGDCTAAAGGSTVLDSGVGTGIYTGSITQITDGANHGGDTSTGVKLACITVQNYGGSKVCGQSTVPTGCGGPAGCTGTGCTENWTSQGNTWNGWIVRNSSFLSSAGCGWGVVGGGVYFEYNYGANNYHCAFGGGAGFDTNNGSSINTISNEAYNNVIQRPSPQSTTDSIIDDAAGLGKYVYRTDLVGSVQNINILNNYVHSTGAVGIWCDVRCGNSAMFSAQGNTLVSNVGEGIRFEDSCNAKITFNVANHNVTGNYTPAGQIYIAGAGSATVMDNTVGAATTYGGGIAALDLPAYGSAPNCNMYNNVVEYNDITFEANGNGAGGYGNNGWNDQCALGTSCGSFYPPSYSSNTWMNNRYSSLAGGSGDVHFQWIAGGFSSTLCTLSQAMAGSGCSGGVGAATEIGSAIDNTNRESSGSPYIDSPGAPWTMTGTASAVYLTNDDGTQRLTNDDGTQRLTAQ